MGSRSTTKARRHKARGGSRYSAAFLFLGSLAAAMLLLAGCGPSTATSMAEATAKAAVAASPTAVALLPSATTESPTGPAAADTVMPATATIETSPTDETPSPAASPTGAPTAEATASATAAASPTAAPPSPPATVSPAPPSLSPTPGGSGAPRVLAFTVSPTVTENVGDVLSISWRAVGARAELCPMRHGPVEARCRQVPLEGSTEFVTDEESLYYAGFGLRVTLGEQVTWGTETVHFQCKNLRTWFFQDPPHRCPAEEAAESYAAAQYFERGLMLWVEDSDLFYVFYEGEDEYGRQSLDVASAQSVKPGASEEERVGEDPPPGLYEPMSGFGLVWRGEVEGVDPAVRERLGWATAPEFGYPFASQCQISVVSGAWTCYLRGPEGEIIRYSAITTAGYPLVWDYYREVEQ